MTGSARPAGIAGDIERLERRATDLGVEVTYRDVDDVEHRADPEVLARVVDILESDRADHRERLVAHVHLDADRPVVVHARITDASLLVDGVPHDVRVEADLAGSHAIVLPDDLPTGCHTLQIDTVDGAAETTVVVAPTSMPGLPGDRAWNSLFVPAYALWERDDPLPSFRHLGALARSLADRGIDMVATLPLYATFLDEPFDPSPYSPISRLHWNEVYIDDADLPAADVPDTGSGMVDWRALGRRRRTQLVAAAAGVGPDIQARLTQFVAEHPDVGAYARFRAGREAGGDAVVERSHVLAQYLCDRALTELHDPAAAGLALDLPIGAHPEGYETWRYPTLFAPGVAVGAPPDSFFAQGQNWGIAAQLPGAMRAGGFELWRAMIARAGRHANLLRLDHVMAVHRLWWVPDGFSADHGVYVRAPQEELLAVIAATAATAGIAVVGENLGTVPPAVGEALDRWELLGMYEEQFAMGGPALAEIPSNALAGVRTHDMDAFAAMADSTDLDAYRSALVTADATRTPDDVRDSGALLEAVLARLARSDARMIVADLDDLLDEHRPHNLPGRVVPGIWQRRLDAPLSETLADDRVTRRLALLGRTTR